MSFRIHWLSPGFIVKSVTLADCGTWPLHWRTDCHLVSGEHQSTSQGRKPGGWVWVEVNRMGDIGHRMLGPVINNLLIHFVQKVQITQAHLKSWVSGVKSYRSSNYKNLSVAQTDDKVRKILMEQVWIHWVGEWVRCGPCVSPIPLAYSGANWDTSHNDISRKKVIILG